MTLQAFAIFDRKAAAYAVPFFFPSVPQGIRAFRATAQDDQSMLNRFPEDFELYRIGTYDDQTGELQAVKPEFLCNAQQAAPTATPTLKEVAS